ncbi:MAG: hypothetical protein WCT30_09895, partial [Desulfurivibrionaceae bacterium]
MAKNIWQPKAPKIPPKKPGALPRKSRGLKPLSSYWAFNFAKTANGEAPVPLAQPQEQLFKFAPHPGHNPKQVSLQSLFSGSPRNTCCASTEKTSTTGS